MLYGLNGAGKSRLLQGIRGALEGSRSDIGISLLARIANPGVEDLAADSAYEGLHPSGAGLALAFAESLRSSSKIDYVASRPRHVAEMGLGLENAMEVIDQWLRARIDTALAADVNALRTEIADDRLFLLHPTGTANAPS